MESEELSQMLWKRIQPYLPEFDVPEEARLQPRFTHSWCALLTEGQMAASWIE